MSKNKNFDGLKYQDFLKVIGEIQDNMIKENQYRVELSANEDDWDLITSIEITPISLTITSDQTTIEWNNGLDSLAKITRRRYD